MKYIIRGLLISAVLFIFIPVVLVIFLLEQLYELGGGKHADKELTL